MNTKVPSKSTNSKGMGAIVKKISMSHIYVDSKMIPVTVLKIEECEVIGHRTIERDGYESVIIGAINKKEHKVNKPQLTHFKSIGITPKSFIKEFRVKSDLEIGSQVTSDLFEVGSFLHVHARTIGKGFMGVMKKFGFAGGNASHGASKSHRLAGSTGGCQDPGRVPPGAKMPGRKRSRFTTARFLEVVSVEGNMILVKGSVPGPKNSYVFINKA